MFSTLLQRIKKIVSLSVSRWDGLLLLWILLLNIALGYRINLILVICTFLGIKLARSVSTQFFVFLIAIFSVIGLLYAPTGVIYGPPDVNVVGSFLYTTPEESLGFIKQTPYYVIILGLAIFILGIVLIRNRSLLPAISKKFRVITTVIFVLIFSIGPLTKKRINLPALRFISDLSTAYHAVSRQNQDYAAIMQKKPIWHPIVGQRHYQTYILVIGESVRRDYVHAFGGQYANTPWLDKAPATLFTNYLSAGPATVISLTNTLVYKADREKQLNNSIVTLAEKSGLDTWWLSNQGVKSHSDSPIARIAKSANHTSFINQGKADYSAASSDENLLPLLENVLKNHNGNNLIILHLMGSHPRACDRTQGRFTQDIGSPELSCYSQSIAMTDALLSKVSALAQHYTKSWTMMYFSDHGLSYVDRHTSSAYLTHGDKTKQNYEVPFFILNSDATQQKVIRQRRSALDFLTTFSQWLRVQDAQIPNSCNMLSDDNCDDVHDVFDFNEKLQNYDTLPSVP